MCLISVGMYVLTCGLLLCCWLVCGRFLDLLFSFVGFLLWLSPSNLLITMNTSIPACFYELMLLYKDNMSVFIC